MRRGWLVLIAGVLVGAGAVRGETFFVAVQDQPLNGLGAWWVNGFSVSSGSVPFVLRVAATYSVDCAIIPAAELSRFQNNQSFRGFAVFDNQFGTKYVTLGAGSYYLAVRNQVSGANAMSVELDKNDTPSGYVPGSRRTLANESRYVAANGGRLWQKFRISDRRFFGYFLDGCNSGGITYWVMDQRYLSRWRSGRSFRYFYKGSGGFEPGEIELRLPSADRRKRRYALAFFNSSSEDEALVYSLRSYRRRN